MDLLILSQSTNSKSPAYRGTYRDVPHYVEGLGDDHEVNRAFFWYVGEGGERGVIHDLQRAQQLVEAYSRLQPPKYFEIVEITKGSYPPTTKGEFLGFDLSTGHYSLLSWGLEIDHKPSDHLPIDDPLWILQPLLRLAKEYFQPRLNLNGLFDDYETANFCLNCMMALQKLRPGLWENEGVNFGVFGLQRVSTE